MQDTDVIRCGHCQLVDQATEALSTEQAEHFRQHLLAALVDLAPLEDLRQAVTVARTKADAVSNAN